MVVDFWTLPGGRWTRLNLGGLLLGIEKFQICPIDLLDSRQTVKTPPDLSLRFDIYFISETKVAVKTRSVIGPPDLVPSRSLGLQMGAGPLVPARVTEGASRIVALPPTSLQTGQQKAHYVGDHV